ncbi:MAG: hypothetical protein R6W67_03205 [Bacteroidales bacterium]
MIPDVDKWIPVISFNDIDVKGTDLLDDAWGFKHAFPEVFAAFDLARPVPSDSLIDGLLSRIETGNERSG